MLQAGSVLLSSLNT